MKRLLSTLLVLCCSIALLGACLPAAALASQTFGSFSAKAVLPDNQVNSRNTYFDLLLEPGGAQTVELRVSNSSDAPMVAEVALNAASTERDGLISYTRPDIRDADMPVSIDEVASLREQAVEVPAGGEASVLIDLQMPDEAFDGVVLGGLVVTRRQQDAEGAEAQIGGVTLYNDLAYVVGLQLRQTTAEVRPELHLLAIEPGTVNYHTAVSVTLRNSEAAVIKNMQVEAAVYPNGEGEALHTLHLESAEMAPHSTGEFVIGWEGEALEPGDYRLRMTARHEDRIWEWDEPFAIPTAVASDANSEAVSVAGRGAQRWLTVLLLLLVLAAIALTVRRICRERAMRRSLEGGAQ